MNTIMRCEILGRDIAFLLVRLPRRSVNSKAFEGKCWDSTLGEDVPKMIRQTQTGLRYLYRLALQCNRFGEPTTFLFFT